MKKIIFHPLMGVTLAFIVLASAWTVMIWIAVKNAPEQIPLEEKVTDDRD